QPGPAIRRWHGRLRARLARFSLTDTVVQLPLLVCVGLVQIVNLPHWPGPVFDEGTYVANAWAVQTHGALSNYTYGYGHPPLGWIMLSLWSWAGGLFGHTVPTIDVSREMIVALTI